MKKQAPVMNGGKRKGAGRKPSPDKSVPITVYLPGSAVKRLGGKQMANLFMKEAALNEVIELDKQRKEENAMLDRSNPNQFLDFSYLLKGNNHKLD